MFWDGVGKSSGRSCERVSMTSSRSPSLIFRVPLFDHPPNVFNLEKKGKGREEGGEITYCYYTWRCFLARMCFKSGWEFSLYHVIASCLLNVGLQVS